MKNLHVSLLLLSIGSFLLVETRPENRPGYIECQDSAECGSFACCVIGTKMYSLPQCMPYLTRGERCLDTNFMSTSKNVTYPDKAQVMYTNVHHIQCPCESGLSCGIIGGSASGGGDGGPPQSVCFDPLLMDNLNSISNSVYDNYY
ncbi:astakine-like isoform X1 [Nilaparvata lugens]|uniref:astakine-like isoform X1 n=1 Tax=Nilaparvata lugens TaxID=108931 RepID=UPI00193D9353|nr:astakine-like isoform X1 [Nilaparvata lugens]XP_039283520.1 astakine-like isoform X1 [Nilaparvata lugens]